MKKFRFKAKCLSDVTELITLMSLKNMRSVTLSYAKGQTEIEVLLDAAPQLSVAEMAKYLCKIENGDLIAQTIQQVEEEPEERVSSKRYKCRAECHLDVDRLLRIVHKGELAAVTIFFHEALPDVEVLLYMAEHVTLATIRGYMYLVDDGHVMWQTVQPEQHYTGDRTDTENNDLLTSPFIHN